MTGMDNARLTIAPRHLALLALPLAVFVGGEWALGFFGDPALAVGPVALVEAPHLAEAAARYRFFAALTQFAAMCIAAMRFLAADLITRHSLRSALWTLGCGLATVLTATLFSVLKPDWLGGYDSTDLLGGDIFTAALGAGTARACAEGPLVAACGGQGGRFVLSYTLVRINVLSALAVVAVAAGAIGSLARPESPQAPQAQGRHLREAQHLFRRNVYFAGALLTTGMLLTRGWMHWPTEVLAPGPQREAFRALADALALYRGVTYSVLILSFALPVSLILRARLLAFEAAQTRAGVADITEAFGVERMQTLDVMKTVLALAAPILAAALGEFGDRRCSNSAQPVRSR